MCDVVDFCDEVTLLTIWAQCEGGGQSAVYVLHGIIFLEKLQNKLNA